MRSPMHGLDLTLSSAPFAFSLASICIQQLPNAVVGMNGKGLKTRFALLAYLSCTRLNTRGTPARMVGLSALMSSRRASTLPLDTPIDAPLRSMDAVTCTENKARRLDTD